MNKKEIKVILAKILILGFFVGVIFYFTQEKPSSSTTNVFLSANNISDTRQIVWVKVDSLVKYLQEIKTQQPNVFEIEEDGNELIFRSLDEKPFNTIFLDGEYLSRFDNVTNTGISKIKSGYGFSLPVEKKSDSRFVRIPTEIIHSIQLQKR